MFGAPSMIKTLKTIATKFPDKVGMALYAEANSIMTKSKRLCPVAPDGGTLRASGYVGKPQRSFGGKITIEVGYGGAAADYAVATHEHLSEHSPPSWVQAEMFGRGIQWNADGTGPKYLEIPVNEAQADMAARIARRINLTVPS